MRLRGAESFRGEEERKEDEFLADSTPIVSQIGDLSQGPPSCEISYNISELPSILWKEETPKLKKRTPTNPSKNSRAAGPLRVERNPRILRKSCSSRVQSIPVVKPQQKGRRFTIG